MKLSHQIALDFNHVSLKQIRDHALGVTAVKSVWEQMSAADAKRFGDLVVAIDGILDLQNEGVEEILS
ncbi:MAG: hypothetical protein GY952_06700 [Rhodobacteraceae bacterium]|nr:hypothetical protein [Paracoccaceae bacterium]